MGGKLPVPTLDPCRPGHFKTAIEHLSPVIGGNNLQMDHGLPSLNG